MKTAQGTRLVAILLIVAAGTVACNPSTASKMSTTDDHDDAGRRSETGETKSEHWDSGSTHTEAESGRAANSADVTQSTGVDAAVLDAALDATVDAALVADASLPGLVPFDACPMPSVDRLEIWKAESGSLKPAVGGNLLVKDGDRYYAKVDFLPGAEWHQIVVPLANSLSKQVDLTKSRGFTLAYSASADLWVQLRPLSHAHGGAQWTAKIPSTGGVMKETFFSFEPKNWGPLLGDPSFPFSEALRDANFFNFVAPPASTNSFVVKGLQFNGYVPSCS